MDKVNVRKAEFIERVTANRDNHRELYDRAIVAYRERAIEKLESLVQDLRQGRRIEQFLDLPEPENHTDDYERILMMAAMSVDDVIELSHADFGMYVMDEWHWKDSFRSTALHYVSL